MRNNRRRHIPKRPRGFYAAYLERLIEENRAKRDPATSDEAEKQTGAPIQQQFKKAA